MSPEDIKKYQRASDTGSIPDDENPIFLFSTTYTKLLVLLLKQEFDIKELVQMELRNRGLNNKGKWVGFGQTVEKKKPNRKSGRSKGRKF